MHNTASRAATRRVPSMGSWAVACPCAILTSLVVRRIPPDPTGMWPEPTRRDTPLEETRCGPSHFQRSRRLRGSAPGSLATRRPRRPKMLRVSIDSWTSTPTLPSAEEDLPTLVHVPVRLHVLGCRQGPESPCSRSLHREPSHTPQPSLVAACELCGFLLDSRTERGFAMRIAVPTVET